MIAATRVVRPSPWRACPLFGSKRHSCGCWPPGTPPEARERAATSFLNVNLDSWTTGLSTSGMSGTWRSARREVITISTGTLPTQMVRRLVAEGLRKASKTSRPLRLVSPRSQADADAVRQAPRPNSCHWLRKLGAFAVHAQGWLRGHRAPGADLPRFYRASRTLVVHPQTNLDISRIVVGMMRERHEGMEGLTCAFPGAHGPGHRGPNGQAPCCS